MYRLEICFDLKELSNFVDEANKRNYEIISFVKDSGGYTVLYKTQKD